MPEDNPVPNPAPTPIPTPEPTPQPIAPQPVQPQPVESQPIEPQPIQPNSLNQTPTTPVPPAKKSNKTLIIILCSLIGIAIIAAVVMIILMNQQPEKLGPSYTSNGSNGSNNQSSTDCGNSEKLIGAWEQKLPEGTSIGYYGKSFLLFRDNSKGAKAIEDIYDNKYLGVEFDYSVTCNEVTITQTGETTKFKLSITDDEMQLTTKEGYTETYTHTSSDPGTIDYDLYDLNTSKNDTQRRGDMSRVISAMSGYYVNNRRYPKTQDDYEMFIKNYIANKKSFTDPDGTKYIPTLVGKCTGSNGCWGKGNNEKNIKEPTSLDHKIYLFYNASCSGDEVIPDDNSKHYAIYYVLQQGNGLCYSGE